MKGYARMGEIIITLLIQQRSNMITELVYFIVNIAEYYMNRTDRIFVRFMAIKKIVSKHRIPL